MELDSQRRFLLSSDEAAESWEKFLENFNQMRDLMKASTAAQSIQSSRSSPRRSNNVWSNHHRGDGTDDGAVCNTLPLS